MCRGYQLSCFAERVCALCQLKESNSNTVVHNRIVEVDSKPRGNCRDAEDETRNLRMQGWDGLKMLQLGGWCCICHVESRHYSHWKVQTENDKSSKLWNRQIQILFLNWQSSDFLFYGNSVIASDLFLKLYPCCWKKSTRFLLEKNVQSMFILLLSFLTWKMVCGGSWHLS